MKLKHYGPPRTGLQPCKTCGLEFVSWPVHRETGIHKKAVLANRKARRAKAERKAA